MPTTIHGKGGMVYMSSGAGVAVKLGEARKWAIKIDRALSEDNAMGDTAVTNLMGLLSWSGSIEGNLDTADGVEFAIATSTTTCLLYLYPVATTSGRNYAGSVWANLSTGVGLEGVARYTLDFTGDGVPLSN